MSERSCTHSTIRPYLTDSRHTDHPFIIRSHRTKLFCHEIATRPYVGSSVSAIPGDQRRLTYGDYVVQQHDKVIALRFKDPNMKHCRNDPYSHLHQVHLPPGHQECCMYHQMPM